MVHRPRFGSFSQPTVFGQERTATIFHKSVSGAFSDETVVGLCPEKRAQIAQHI